ncbi:sigma-70 family RNA polymerase sigma factor [Streptomyces sp. NPDC056169]|uniref:sigma-70 family RNA polymerase sigma factor n=1 Tax=Streptomyces sp. NPDC056169 TaxID=3345734 RepID=UPI0035D9883B
MTLAHDTLLHGPTAPPRPARAPDADAATTRLALAARDGDPAMADLFVRALQRDVRRYVTYLGADRQAADDLTQEVFLRALAALPRFEGRSSARTWLLSIARRTVVDSLRYAAARPRLSDRDDWQTEAEHTQPRGLPGFEDGIALAELLAALPAERRDAFVLTQLLGLPYAEAAEAIGCPVGTVRSRVARARASLIALLRGEDDDTPPTPLPGTVPAPGLRPVTSAAAAGNLPPHGHVLQTRRSNRRRLE